MNIILYTMDHCSMCDLAKDYLDELELDYEIRNVSTNKDYRNDLLQRGHMGVPIIEIDGNDIIGFDEVRLDELLKEESSTEEEKEIEE